MFAKFQELREEREEGFTLIELLVVILIIGILSAIAIPAFLNQRKSAVDSSVQSDVSNAAKMIETATVKAGATSANIFIGTKSGNSYPITVTTAATLALATTANTVATTDAKVSDGTVLTLTGSTGSGYYIQGTNPGGDVSNKGVVAAPTGTTTGVVYESVNGGLKNR